MRHNKKLKAYGTVLALGAGALVVDRLLPGPSTAAAAGISEAATALASALPALVTAAPTQGAASERIHLADQLRSVAAGHTDPSALDALFAALTPPPSEDTTTSSEGRAAAANGAANAAPRLTSVLVAEGASAATINGQTLTIGQSIAGYTLTSIDREGCTLTNADGQAIRLTIDLPTLN